MVDKWNEIQRMQLESLKRTMRGVEDKFALIVSLLSKIYEAAEAEHIPLSLNELLLANKDKYDALVKEAKAVVAALPDDFNMG